jgi:hypothetical protein
VTTGAAAAGGVRGSRGVAALTSPRSRSSGAGGGARAWASASPRRHSSSMKAAADMEPMIEPSRASTLLVAGSLSSGRVVAAACGEG